MGSHLWPASCVTKNGFRSESEDDAVVPVGEADPGVGRAILGARRLGGGLDGLPLVAAVVRDQDGLLIACGPTVVLVDEIDPDRGGRRVRAVVSRALRLAT